MIDRVDIHPGRYHDSVRLMQASKALQNVDGVADARRPPNSSPTSASPTWSTSKVGCLGWPLGFDCLVALFCVDLIPLGV